MKLIIVMFLLLVCSGFHDLVFAADDSWTGIYVGGQAGHGWSNIEITNMTQNGIIEDYEPGTKVSSHNISGWLGGGQVGFNYDFGSWVAGVEAAITGGEIDGESRSHQGNANDTYGSKIGRSILATLRLGYSWDSWLAYIKGGYASTRVTTTISDTSGAAGNTRDSHFHNGYVVGAGLEYKLLPNLIIGGEYNFIDPTRRLHSWKVANPFLQAIVTDSVNKVNPKGVHIIAARLSFLFNL